MAFLTLHRVVRPLAFVLGLCVLGSGALGAQRAAAVKTGGSHKVLDCSKSSVLGTPLPLVYYCWSELGTPTPYNTSTGAIAFDFGYQASDEINYFDYTHELNNPQPYLFAQKTPHWFNVAGHLDTTGAPYFEFHTDSGNVGCDANPSSARPWLLAYDDWYGEFHRWWYAGPSIVLQPGSFQLMVPIDPSLWSSVYGKYGTAAPTDWANALTHVTAIGLSFGGGCFYGHGVYVTPGTGTATFVVNSLTIN